MKNELKLSRRAALMAGAGVSLAGCAQQPQLDPLPAPDGPFKHGVASGDPDQTSVVLWTAVSASSPGPVSVEVAADPTFAQLLLEAEAAPAGPAVEGVTPFKIIADGLRPGQPIWYRFRHGGAVSPVGAAKPLPEGPVEAFRIAAFACSNYPAGFFNAYRHAAERGDVDLAIHLGDYLYEYEMGGFATGDAARLARVPEPAHELISYADYARRHAQYSGDPDLQALKAAVPMLLIWDDHETANNSWRGGAQNHQDDEGDWVERRDVALAAWQAWTPSRPVDPMHERWGAMQIGDLATLIFLETRLSARDAEITIDQFPIDPDLDPYDPANRQRVADWLVATAGAQDRRLLGERQLADVSAALTASVDAGQPWRVFANQVIMGRVPAPDYRRVMPFWLRWIVQSADPLAWEFMKRFSFGTPLNLDAWDGYGAERERLYAAARAANADFIALTGDTHNFWTIDLHDEAGERVGAEFGVTSVSSPSRFERLNLPTVDFGLYTEEHAPEVVRHNAYDRGYVHLTLTREAATAEFVIVDTIASRDFTTRLDSVWRVRPALGGPVPAVARIG